MQKARKWQAFLVGCARMAWGLFVISLVAMLAMLTHPVLQQESDLYRLASAGFLVSYVAVMIVMLMRLSVDDDIRSAWRKAGARLTRRKAGSKAPANRKQNT